MEILRHGFATWSGTVPKGSGTMRLGREGVELPFSLRTRTEDVPGTNPEELLGAAHAGCFSMALSSILEDAGHPARSVQTEALVTLEGRGGSFTISKVALTTRGDVDLDEAEFVRYAEEAKRTCPVSKLFASAEITLQASITS